MTHAMDLPVVAVPVPETRITEVASHLSRMAPDMLGDPGQAQFLSSFVAVMDQDTRVHSALSGHREVADQACLAMALALVNRAMLAVPTASQPYLLSAVNSIRAALAVRDDVMTEHRFARGH